MKSFNIALLPVLFLMPFLLLQAECNNSCLTYEQYADMQNRDLFYAQQAHNIEGHQDNQSVEDFDPESY